MEEVKKNNKVMFLEIFLIICMCLVTFSGTIEPLVNARTIIYIALLGIAVVLVALKREKLILNNIIQIQWLILLLFLVLGLVYTIDSHQLLRILLQYFFYTFLILMSFKSAFYSKILDTFLWVCTILGIIIIITLIDKNFVVNNFSFLYSESTIKSIIGRTASNAYGGLLGEVAYSAFAMNIGISIIVAKYLTYRKITIANWIQLTIFIIGVLVSFKRSLLLIPVLAFLILFIISKKNNKIKNGIKLFTLLIVIILIVITIFPETLDTIGRFNTETTNGDVLNGRTELWEYSWEMFLQNPLIGLGYCSYTMFCASNGFEWNYMAHNIYVQLLGEVGIIGFIIFITFFINAIIKTLKSIKKECNEQNLQLLYFSLFMQIVFLLYGLTGNPLYFPQQMMVYIICISILSNIRNKRSRKK